MRPTTKSTNASGDDEEGARTYYDAFHGHDAALRFDCLDPAARQAPALDAGLLRRGAAEILFLHCDGNAFTSEDWRFWREVAVGGGLAQVFHEDGAAMEPGAGWTTLRAGRRSTLLQAPPYRTDELDEPALPGPRWVLGEPQGWAGVWATLLDDLVEPVARPHARERTMPKGANSSRGLRG